MKISIQILAILILGSFYSCEEVPVIIPEKMIIETGKVVLVEDVTGVDCSNCPAAAARLEELAKENEGNVIIVGVHGIQQAAPIPGKSKYDFRNEDAATLETYLRPWLGKPAAAFNRIQFEDQENLSLSFISTFASKLEEVLSIPQTIAIETDKSYDADSRTLTISAGVTALEDLEGDFYITAMVTESHIIDYQLDPAFGGYDPNYEHNHVLRDIITSPTGDQFATELIRGEIVPLSWTYQIPESDDGLWVVENLDIIIAVSDLGDGGKDVLQSAIFKVID